MTNFSVRLQGLGYTLQSPPMYGRRGHGIVVQAFFAAKLVPRSAGHVVRYNPQIIQQFMAQPFPDNTYVYRQSWLDPDGLAILMDYFPLTLRQLIDPHIQLTERQWLQLMCGIVNRLAFTHAFNVVHGDLCPSNILVNVPVNYEYNPYTMHITDFGIGFFSQLVDQAGHIHLVPGCIEYMAPELRNLDRTDTSPQSDMWSVGAIGYELTLSQEMDSTSPSFVPIENYLRPGQELNLSQIPNRFSNYVHQIVRDCLQRDPARRISADSLRTRIQQLLVAQPPSPTGTLPPAGWI